MRTRGISPGSRLPGRPRDVYGTLTVRRINNSRMCVYRLRYCTVFRRLRAHCAHREREQLHSRTRIKEIRGGTILAMREKKVEKKKKKINLTSWFYRTRPLGGQKKKR